MSTDNWVKMGIVTHVHGIKGEFTFNLPSGEETVLEDGSLILILPESNKSSLPKNGREIKIERLRFGQKIIAKLEGIADRTEAEKILPFSVNLKREEFTDDLEDGEFYLVDLIGVAVFDSHDREKLLGKIDDYYENGAQTVLVLNLNGELMDLPFVDNFFPEIDLPNKKVFVNLPIFLDAE